jgi:hypothetical protein
MDTMAQNWAQSDDVVMNNPLPWAVPPSRPSNKMAIKSARPTAPAALAGGGSPAGFGPFGG